MGCSTSSAANEPNASSNKTTTKPSSVQEQSMDQQVGSNPMSSETSNVATSSAAGTPSVKATAKNAPKKAPKSAPAPGVKKVRAAYSGKGWAPPQKEWDSTKKEKGDKVKIEIEDEWDDDGNLKRTTTKRITTPDWKFKTEKTVELFSPEEAEKLGLGRK